VAELKRRREDTSNRMENGGNQDGDDESSHGKSGLTLRAELRRRRVAWIATGARWPGLLRRMFLGVRLNTLIREKAETRRSGRDETGGSPRPPRTTGPT
jgi:hypothetical protein